MVTSRDDLRWRSAEGEAGQLSIAPKVHNGCKCLQGAVELGDDLLGQAELMRRRHRRVPPLRSGFAGFRFPREVIVLAVRWYLRYVLSYRDVEELLAERGFEVDHVTIYRWVQRFTPLVIDAAQPCRHSPVFRLTFPGSVLS
jgi:hypothetical protein